VEFGQVLSIECVYLYYRLFWVWMWGWRVRYRAFIDDEEGASPGLRVCRTEHRTGSSTPSLPEADTYLQP
jgi:hypothetical protein